MKKRNWLIIALLALLIIPFATVKAADLKTGNIINIKEGEIINGNLYASGLEIIIDGNVSGDLIVAAEKVTVNGELGGDLIALASKIEVNGLIGGNLRAAASEITVYGEIKRNATVAASKIIFEKGSILFWDLMSLSEDLSLNGNVKGYVNATSKNIGINGLIEKDASFKLEGEEEILIISPESEIQGNLSYVKNENSFINNQGKITGVINASDNIKKSDFNFWPYASGRLLAILAALLAAVALSYGLKKHKEGIIKEIGEDPLKSFLYGLIILIASPLALLILALTVIGIPLALSLGAIYAAALYLTKVLSAIYVGDLLFNKIIKKDSNKFLIIFSGIFICWLLFSIPFVGIIFALAASSLGLGGILKYVRN